MNLEQLSAQPKLIKFTLDQEEIVERYGEPLDFWMYDRQDLDSFMRLASINSENPGEILSIVKDLVRDSKGKLILEGSSTLPMDVMVKVLETVVSHLGKAASQTTAT